MLTVRNIVLLATAIAAIASPALAAVAPAPVLGEDLIGEEVVNAANAKSFADRMIAESYRILDSSAGWTVMQNTTSTLSESKPVTGVFQRAKVYVTRCQAVIDVVPQALYGALISPEGFAIIDPFSNPEDHFLPPLEVFPTDGWRPNTPEGLKFLLAAKTSSKTDTEPDREFVVLNAIDIASGLLVSKSIQHANWPGVSEYGKRAIELGKPKNPRNVRALNTFALEVTPIQSEGKIKSRVRVVNYANLGSAFPSYVSNLVNKQFLNGLIDRFQLLAYKINSSPAPPAASP